MSLLRLIGINLCATTGPLEDQNVFRIRMLTFVLESHNLSSEPKLFPSCSKYFPAM